MHCNLPKWENQIHSYFDESVDITNTLTEDFKCLCLDQFWFTDLPVYICIIIE